MAPRNVVMFSSGAGSWAAARRVADAEGTDGLVLLFADVLGEDEDNYRFLHEAAADVGGELVIVRDGRTIWDVFRDRRFLGNSRQANCSQELKQEPCRRWLEENADPETTTLHVGIDWSEQHRMAGVRKGWAPYRVSFPMTEPPYVDKVQVLAQLAERGIKPPRLYALGFQHANCGGGCVRAGSGQFVRLLETMPERFADWEREEQGVREFLGRDDVAICRDWSNDGAPMTLTEVRERHEGRRGGQLDLLDMGGCGCFTAEEASD